MQLLRMLEENKSKPADEQLARSDFVLDLNEQRRQEAARAEAVRALRNDIELQILEQQLRRENIKQQCWDGMHVRGKMMTGFDTDIEVRTCCVYIHIYTYRYIALSICACLHSV